MDASRHALLDGESHSEHVDMFLSVKGDACPVWISDPSFSDHVVSSVNFTADQLLIDVFFSSLFPGLFSCRLIL
jgi:hypothetical protein